MNNKPSRRQFLTAAAAAGLPAVLWPNNTLAASLIPDNSLPEKGLVFLFQGDSITDGNRGRNTDPNHIMGHGYAFAIASRVGADFPEAGYTFYNRGISGNKVPDLQQRWQSDALDIMPDVLSVLIGINDTAAVVEQRNGAQTVDEFETGYRDLLTRSRTANPGVLLLLGLPFVTEVGNRKNNFGLWKEEAAQRAARVRKLAKEFDALVVDYPAVFEKAASRAPADYWIWDGIHPTVAGHELMAREWIKKASARLLFLKKYKY